MLTQPHHQLTLKEAMQVCQEEGNSAFLQNLSQRIAKLNPQVNAYVRFDPESSVVSGDESGLLKGAPIAIKDNLCIDGTEVLCCSEILKGYVAPYDATVIAKLKASGASLLGQCNMDEFAFGSSCETSIYGGARNPWNLDYVAGGSSGGSAAAVAADMAIAALGSDTGGSIRQPASLCGVVGLKPTYGRVSRYGLIAFGSSFDQIGPLTKTVEDAALLLNVISGHDALDSTSVKQDVPDFTKSLIGDVKGLKIGLPKEYFVEGLDPEVEKAVREAAAKLEEQGAELKEITLPHTEYSVAVYYIVAVAEASSNLGRFDGVRYGNRASAKDLKELYMETRGNGFGPEVKRRILLGTFVLSAGYYDAYYLKGQKVRTFVRQDFDKAFEDVDVILSPTSPTTSFKFGEKSQDPLSMYLSDIFTIPANLAGIPAISIPCGFSSQGLPIGLQLMAPAFDEETLLRTAHAYEQSTEFHKQRPELDA